MVVGQSLPAGRDALVLAVVACNSVVVNATILSKTLAVFEFEKMVVKRSCSA